MSDPGALLDTALHAAAAGAQVLLERYRQAREVDFKGARTDLVTDADRASEAAVTEVIRRRHPDHALLAEEGTETEGDAGLRWVVDPLDGTVNYAHRIPHWCVSVAVEDAAGPVAGVVHDPLRGEVFAAARGQGATLAGAPIRVSEQRVLADAMLATGFAYREAAREANLRLLGRLVVASRGLRRLGSAALDLAYVAAGRFDGFWELGLSRWDVCAGALLVTEAGGRVVGFAADEDPLETGRIIASAPGIAGALEAEVRAVVGSDA